MKITVAEIARLVGGRAAGDTARVIEGAAGLLEADPSDVSFVRDLAKAETREALARTRAGAVLLPKGAPGNGKTHIEVENPMAAFATVLKRISDEKTPRRRGVHPTAVIDPTATVGADVFIGPHCVIEANAKIGDRVQLIAQVYVGPGSQVGSDSLIYAGVVFREYVTVGARCIIHPGTVIGSDGFGFFYSGGKHNKIPQIGTVAVGDDVEIGAGAAIDRATTGTTRVGSGTKIDNLVHIAHNVEIGERSLLAAQVGIAGSTTLGPGVALGGQAGVADHVVLGAGVQVGAQSGIHRDVPPKTVMFGTPAQPIQDTIKQSLLAKRLPELFKDVKKLKREVEHK